MTNRWTRLWMFETKRMVNWMQEGVKLRFQKCFKKWLFEVNHHKNSEIQRLKKLATDEEEKHRLELLEGVETTSVDLWHPAEGIVNMKGQLTALPKIFCSYNTNGSLNVEGERAKRASLLEDEHPRAEVHEMATDEMATSATKLS